MRNISYISLFLFLMTSIALPASMSAQVILDPSTINVPQDVGRTGTFTGTDDPSSSSFQLVSCTGVVDPRTGKGVECTYNHLVETFERVIKFVLYIMIPIVLGMIIYVGFTYLTAGGDSGKLAKAKSMIVPILLGLFFILAAWLIVFTLLDFLLANKIGDIDKSSSLPVRNQ